jgi:hypothetical protein
MIGYKAIICPKTRGVEEDCRVSLAKRRMQPVEPPLYLKTHTFFSLLYFLLRKSCRVTFIDYWETL